MALSISRQPRQRRQWTLFLITVSLHILGWSSIFAFGITVYLFATSRVNLQAKPLAVSGIMIALSAAFSISYVFLHTIVSQRQRRWPDTHFQTSFVQKICYLSFRLAVTLCILWLLTTGWNLIIISRQPTCLLAGSSAESWQPGLSCVLGRVSIAFSMVALVSSFIVFSILSAVRRPFEADILGQCQITGRLRSSSAPSCMSHQSHTGSRCSSPTKSLGTRSWNSSLISLDDPESTGLGIFTPDEATFTARSGTFKSSSSKLSNSDVIARLAPILHPTPPSRPSTAWLAVHPVPNNPPAPCGSPQSALDRPSPILSTPIRFPSISRHKSNRSSRSSSSGTLPRSPLSSMRRVGAPDVEILPQAETRN